MPSRKQIEANRRNAQKSTGPVTAEGKAACAMNAFKTGLYAESLLIPGEKLEDLQQLIADYYREHNPTTPEQRESNMRGEMFVIAVEAEVPVDFGADDLK